MSRKASTSYPRSHPILRTQSPSSPRFQRAAGPGSTTVTVTRSYALRFAPIRLEEVKEDMYPAIPRRRPDLCLKRLILLISSTTVPQAPLHMAMVDRTIQPESSQIATGTPTMPFQTADHGFKLPLRRLSTARRESESAHSLIVPRRAVQGSDTGRRTREAGTKAGTASAKENCLSARQPIPGDQRPTTRPTPIRIRSHREQEARVQETR